MKIIKKQFMKITSSILALLILISALSVSAFAFTKDEFDISDLTWEELMAMDADEFHQLLIDFERVYDPFGTYETNPIMLENAPKDKRIENGLGVQPLWTSGHISNDGTVKDTGSHEMITAKACGILLKDKGFWGNNESGNVMIALMLSLASILPDRDPAQSWGSIWTGHYYSAATQTSIGGGSEITAKSCAQNHYYDACAYYNGENNENFIASIGCAIHYVQDVCVPHHSTNLFTIEHSDFENHVNDSINTFLNPCNSLSNEQYNWGLNKSVGDIVHDTAHISSGYIGKVLTILNKKNWDNVAYDTVRLAVERTAMVLYKISVEENIPLVK